MTSHVLFAAVGLCLLAAVQPARADSISCSYTAGRDPSGVTAGPSGGATSFGIEGIDFELDHADTIEPQATARVGKAHIHDMTFTKKTDKASAGLFRMAASGTPLTSLTCSFSAEAQVTGAPSTPYLTAVLTDAKISRFKTQTAADGTPRMSITLVYDQLQWKF